MALEEKLIKETARLDELFKTLFDHVDRMKVLGLDASGEASYLSENLSDRAEILAGQIKLTLEEIASTKDLVKENPDNADIQASFRAAEAKLERTTQSRKPRSMS